MDKDALIRCLRRFISRRGSLNFSISDNFKTFLAKEVRQYLTSERIRWSFILPKSPWWGGFYERLIRIVKEALKKIVGNAMLTYEELETVLCEIEMITNSRPLTYIYNDVAEGEVITPSHLAIGRRLMSKDLDNNNGDDINELSNIDITRRYRYLKTLLHHYWNRFHTEYLHELREKHLADNKRKKHKDVVLHTGDLVLIQDDKQKRQQWKKGVVQSIIYGDDNKIRGAVLKTITNGNPSFLKRPVQRLVPFEISCHVDNESVKVVQSDDVHNDNEKDNLDILAENDANDEDMIAPVRSRRIAAVTGELKRRLIEEDLDNFC